MQTACRICGRNDWKADSIPSRLTARGIHEAGHVRRGEAKWIMPSHRGEERGIEKTENNGVIVPQNNAQPNNVHHHANGDPASWSPNTTCELCGEGNFASVMSWASHRNWHVRRGEGKWRGPRRSRQLVATAKGETLYINNRPGQLQQQQQQPQQAEALEEVVEIPYEQLVAGAFTDMQKAVTLMQMAIALQTVPQDRAAQLAANLPNLAMLPRRR